MIRRFLRDSVLYTFSAVLTRGISFVLLPLYTAVLSPDEFGTYDYINVIGSFILVTATLEVAQGIHRFVPEAREDLEERRSLASTALLFTCACYAALILLFGLFSGALASSVLGVQESGHLVTGATVMFASSALLILVQAQLRSELRVGEHIRSAIIVSVASAAFSAIGLLWLKAGVMGLIAGITLGNLTGFAYAFGRSRDVYRLRFSIGHLKTLLQFSAPLVPSSIGVISALLIDRIMIKNMMSLEDLGIFGIAARIAVLTSLLSMGVQQALTPLIYTKYKDEGTPREIARLFWMFCGLAVLAVLGIWAITPLLLTIMVPPTYYGAAPLVPIVSASVLVSTLYNFAPGLVLAKRTGIISLISIATAILSLVSNLLLIPHYGLMGSAVGTLLAALGGFILHIIVAHPHYPVPYLSRLRRPR
jgi:O-antigen/teichoic acid export membrane protein